MNGLEYIAHVKNNRQRRQDQATAAAQRAVQPRIDRQQAAQQDPVYAAYLSDQAAYQFAPLDYPTWMEWQKYNAARLPRVTA